MVKLAMKLTCDTYDEYSEVDIKTIHDNLENKIKASVEKVGGYFQGLKFDIDGEKTDEGKYERYSESETYVVMIVEYYNVAGVVLDIQSIIAQLDGFSSPDIYIEKIEANYEYDNEDEQYICNPDLDESCIISPLVSTKEGIYCSAYDELMHMVGLDNVKQVVRQMLATHRINKLRKEYGFSDSQNSRHMIFTGNPGTAKTTVARLLAKIMFEKGITINSNVVECGRADLIGKYTGHTPPLVRKAFSKAMGGILFIDEAYSLVANDDKYGDEAINTIVQEMENHRDNVIVIFAGYPDKMAKFLEKNQGLHSRIAFHLEFNDYSTDELMNMLDLMLIERSYKITPEARAKCFHILQTAKKAANFGNGRSVRNLLEKAFMNQALRLDSLYQNSNPDKEEVMTLKAEDFYEYQLEQSKAS